MGYVSQSVGMKSHQDGEREKRKEGEERKKKHGKEGYQTDVDMIMTQKA